MTTKATGDRGEALAADFLEAQGLRVLERNFRFNREEVDLVLYAPYPHAEGGEIVFCEVKTRRGAGFGRPEEAVDKPKQLAIRRVAEAFLHEMRLEGAPVRFDVVAVTLGEGEPEIEHFPHAFGMFFG